jgi:hypothetical protein
MDKLKSKEALKELKKRDKALKESNKALDKTLEKFNNQEISLAEYFIEKLEEKLSDEQN